MMVLFYLPNCRALYFKVSRSYIIRLHLICGNPPASEVSREIANFIKRKNPHTPVYGVKEFVYLSVCLSVCDKL